MNEIKLDHHTHPTVTIGHVLSKHHRSSISQVICYCGFVEERSPVFDLLNGGLDLHRAEVLWDIFRIEDA